MVKTLNLGLTYNVNNVVFFLQKNVKSFSMENLNIKI